MENGPTVNELRQVEVTLLSPSNCAIYSEYQSDRMLCVGDPSGGKDACQVKLNPEDVYMDLNNGNLLI